MEKGKEEFTKEPFNKKIKYAKIVFYLFFLAASLIFFGASSKSARAASLYFSPASGSYAVGDAFSVSIFISSAEQAMNAASGVISFPAAKLEVSSISKSGSIFSLWVQEPAFSNTSGVINFEGIVMNPGFSGADGKIATINFKAKAGEEASLIFSSGAILANDGKGTDILSNLGGAKFVINDISLPAKSKEPAPIPEKTTPLKETEQASSSGRVPAAPEVSSPTHSNQEKWYNNNNPAFEFVLPKGTTGVNVLADRVSNTNPGARSDGLFSSYTYNDVDDGVWYFHIKLLNAYGWGEVAHFRFQIDTEPPEPLTIQFIEGKEIVQPRMKVGFNTVDALSGIDYYQIKISDLGELNVSSDEFLQHNPYTLPPEKPGVHEIQVVAFDKAGNSAAAIDTFTIKPGLAPEITDYPRKLKSGETFAIKGKTAYPAAQVSIWLQGGGDELKNYIAESDKDGIFSFEGKEELTDGVYKLWAAVIDEEKNQGQPSETATIIVGQSLFSKAKLWTIQTGARAIEFLAVAIPIIAMIALLTFLVWYGWIQFSKLRIKARREIRQAERALHKALSKSRRDIKEQIKTLEKIRERQKQAEEQENKIVEQLKKDLKYAEGLTKKEIKEIKKELE